MKSSLWKHHFLKIWRNSTEYEWIVFALASETTTNKFVQLLSSRYEVYKLSRLERKKNIKECGTFVCYIRQCIKWHWHWCAPAQDMEDIVHLILTGKFTSIILHVVFFFILLLSSSFAWLILRTTINCISKFAFNVPVTHDVCLWNGCVNRFFFGAWIEQPMSAFKKKKQIYQQQHRLFTFPMKMRINFSMNERVCNKFTFDFRMNLDE